MLFLMSLIHLLHPCPSHQGSAAQAQDLTQATFFCLTPAALPIQNELPERAINRLRDYVTAATSQVTSWQRLCLIILVEARSAAIGNCWAWGFKVIPTPSSRKTLGHTASHSVGVYAKMKDAPTSTDWFSTQTLSRNSFRGQVTVAHVLCPRHKTVLWSTACRRRRPWRHMTLFRPSFDVTKHIWAEVKILEYRPRFNFKFKTHHTLQCPRQVSSSWYPEWPIWQLVKWRTHCHAAWDFPYCSSNNVQVFFLKMFPKISAALRYLAWNDFLNDGELTFFPQFLEKTSLLSLAG